MTKKKLKEKEEKEKEEKETEEKEKKRKRKVECFDDFVDYNKEANLESIKIDLQDLPILSFAEYNGYICIVKRKSCNDKKLDLIITNIDIELNNKLDYNFDEAFNDNKTDKKFIQTQNEIEMKMNENQKVKDVLLSKDYVYLSFKDSTFQQWLILND